MGAGVRTKAPIGAPAAAGVADALQGVVGALPGGGEARGGQREMATTVEGAIDGRHHLVVQAGTGTGKSLAYLVPALLSGRRVVVATATKALQDQLAGKDLPFLAEHLDVPVEWAVLKGRSNYVCLQRLREATVDDAQGALAVDDVSPSVQREVKRLASWAATSPSGDQAELTWPVSQRAWQAVSVSSEECPGATRCPLGEPCFAELARRRAQVADVVVVNTHLYGLHLASGEALLPDHDVVVFDEAHQLEDIISATMGVAVGATRVIALGRNLRSVLTPDATVALDAAGSRLSDVLRPWLGKRLPQPLPGPIVEALAAVRGHVDAAQAALRAVDTEVGEANQRKVRAQKAATSFTDDLDAALHVRDGRVAFVSGLDEAPRLEVAPIEVGPVLAALWEKRTAILTSATIPASLPVRLGLPDTTEVLDVGSPFDYHEQAVLYCAAHLPDPRDAGFGAAMHEELAALIDAAGGRTLALFTSWRAMEAAAEAIRADLPYRVLTQRDLPKPELLASFAREETSCLFATAGLFQGIDVPGDTLRLVTIDRIPFPRPDDPLLDARREAAGAAAFRLIDLPRASTLLAQAAGRLIRSSTDAGVVAVFDRRLANAGYRWDVVKALPPMRRTRHRTEAETFLRSLRD